MTPIQCRTLLVIAALTLAAHNEALACTCVLSGPPCEAAWTADVVFAGRVRSVVEIDHEEHGAPYRSMVVTFDVERGFLRGVPERIEILTGTSGSACGYSFATGQRYLVYAWKTPSSRLSTSICSRTRPLDQADEDLRYLTSMPAPGRGALVYGRISEHRRDPAEEMPVDYGPVEGVTVTIRGATFLHEVTTDVHGRYEVPNVPSGRVLVAVIPPHGFDRQHLERELELRDPRACGEADFTISQIAAVWGSVVDAAGRPLAGVDVEAVAAELAGSDPRPLHRPARTDLRGVFEFEDLPPGVYVFGVNLTTRPGERKNRHAMFLPGTALAREARVVELKPGDRRDLGVLRLPER